MLQKEELNSSAVCLIKCFDIKLNIRVSVDDVAHQLKIR